MGRLLLYLFELAIIFVLVVSLRRALRQLLGIPQVFFRTRSSSSRQRNVSELRHGETARDPVCGMFVSTELSHRLTRGNETLHFCSQACLEQYQKRGEHAAS
jgi:YHS domain-containing protein